MGLVDVFSLEDKLTLSVSNLMGIMRSDALNWAQNQVMINGLKADLNSKDILTMIGEVEDPEPNIYFKNEEDKE